MTMKIERFEDIKAWQEAKILVNLIYKSVKNNKDLSNDLRLKSQITSAAISIMSNIAEGFSRNSNKEFIRFLFISKGSIAELQSLLHVCLDLKYVSNADFENIYSHTELAAKLISKFISYLKEHLAKTQ